MVENKYTSVPSVYAVFLCATGYYVPLVLGLCARYVSIIIAISLFAFISIRHITGCYFRREYTVHSGTAIFLLCSFLAGLSSVLVLMHADKPPRTLCPPDSIVRVSGIVRTDPVSANNDTHRLVLSVNEVQDSDRAVFSADGRITVLIPSPCIRERLPGGIGYRGALPVAPGLPVVLDGMFQKSRKTGQYMFIANTLHSEENFTNASFSARARVRLSLIRLCRDFGDPGAFLLALITGNRDMLDITFARLFRQAGVSHILALSGMHLSIIALIAVKAGSRIGGKRFSIRLSLCAMIFFLWIASSSPSLDRALIMAFIATSMKRMGSGRDIAAIVCLCFVIQVLISPASPLSLSFQLSYASLFGILLPGAWIQTLCEPCIDRKISGPFAVSVGAQLFTAPITAATIGLLVPAGIPASIVLSPLASLYLASGIGVLPLAAANISIRPALGYILDLQFRLFEALLHFFSRFPSIHTEDLSASRTAGILSLVSVIALYIGAKTVRIRRLPDAGFTGL